jgi:hypothetical protein
MHHPSPTHASLSCKHITGRYLQQGIQHDAPAGRAASGTCASSITSLPCSSTAQCALLLPALLLRRLLQLLRVGLLAGAGAPLLSMGCSSCLLPTSLRRLVLTCSKKMHGMGYSSKWLGLVYQFQVTEVMTPHDYSCDIAHTHVRARHSLVIWLQPLTSCVEQRLLADSTLMLA